MAHMKVVLVVVLVAVMLIPDSDAWRRRRRRDGCGCGWFGCHCSGKKRDQPETLQDIESDHAETKMDSIPNKFSFYDANKDNKITINEFFRALRMGDNSAMPFFKEMDRNGDDVITCDEFKNAKDLPFKTKPQC